MAKQTSHMLIPDDEDQEILEVDQEAKKRWIKDGDKPAIIQQAPIPPPVTKKQVLMQMDSDLVEMFDKAAKENRMTRTAWLIQAGLEKLKRDNI